LTSPLWPPPITITSYELAMSFEPLATSFWSECE
jgi:hypothetical protein